MLFPFNSILCCVCSHDRKHQLFHNSLRVPVARRSSTDYKIIKLMGHIPFWTSPPCLLVNLSNNVMSVRYIPKIGDENQLSGVLEWT